MSKWSMVRQTPYEYCDVCKQDIGPGEVFEIRKPSGGGNYLWAYACEACARKRLGDVLFCAEKARMDQVSTKRREAGKALALAGRNNNSQ